MKTRKLVLYNNKGGVSKTTTLFNLAAYMATRKSHRVLLVDSDPQCNLTELFFASIDGYEDPAFSLPGTSIYEALRPRFEGEVAHVDAASVNLVASERYKSLYLLRGDLKFSLAERYFSESIYQAPTVDIHQKRTYLAFNSMLNELISVHHFDYVLVDVGPSSGALTQMAFLAMDAFILPTTPDRFCYQAVSVLGMVIEEWIERHNRVAKSFERMGLASYPGKPLLLGAISQNFKMVKGHAAVSYTKWEEMISAQIKQSFVDSRTIPTSKKLNLDSPYIAQIKNVETLAPVAQMYGRAMFDLEQGHTKAITKSGQPYYGKDWLGFKRRMKSYEEQIGNIAAVVDDGTR